MATTGFDTSNRQVARANNEQPLAYKLNVYAAGDAPDLTGAAPAGSYMTVWVGGANGTVTDYREEGGAWVAEGQDADAAAPWQANTAYVADVEFSARIPTVGGPYLDSQGQTLTAGAVYNFVYPTDQTSGAALDTAEFAKFETVGQVSGEHVATLQAFAGDFLGSDQTWSIDYTGVDANWVETKIVNNGTNTLTIGNVTTGNPPLDRFRKHYAYIQNNAGGTLTIDFTGTNWTNWGDNGTPTNITLAPNTSTELELTTHGSGFTPKFRQVGSGTAQSGVIEAQTLIATTTNAASLTLPAGETWQTLLTKYPKLRFASEGTIGVDRYTFDIAIDRIEWTEEANTRRLSFYHDGTNFIVWNVGAVGNNTAVWAGGGAWASVSLRVYGIENLSQVGFVPDSQVADATNEFNQVLDAVAGETATFVPSVSGAYEWTQRATRNNNELVVHLGSTPGGQEFSPANWGNVGADNRLGHHDGDPKELVVNVNLVAGQTYYISTIVGGGTTLGLVLVNIRRKGSLIAPDQGPLYNQANTGGVATSAFDIVDIGFALQDGDEIMLQLDIGMAKAIWRGASVNGSVGHEASNNRILFSQTGTTLRGQGANTNGTRQWLKIVR